MIKSLMLVACGGMIGTVARYILSSVMLRDTPGAFPTGTFLVNLTGCLAIGIIWGLQSRYGWISKEWELFLLVGLCGGYTTFSAFSLENVRLLQQGHISVSLIYSLMSVIFGITLTFFGYVLTRNA